LDEIGDLSPAAQAKMLRVLELRKLRRVGASEEIDVDVRVIVASNVALDQLVESGKFRRDLYYRLNVYTIELLPLRERREDILPLAERFLAHYDARRDTHLDGFSPAARDALMAYDYPGNARELRNLIERAAILARDGQIQKEHLNLGQSTRLGNAPASAPSADDERARIVRALEQARWNRRDAAESLGMPYSTLRYKMQKLGITK
jgi:DNA-binding NtrC family response regulator